MRTFLGAAIIALACLLPVTSFAQAQIGKLILLRIPDSLKDTEIYLAKVLLDRLKINASLQSPKGNAKTLFFAPASRRSKTKIFLRSLS